MPNTILHSSETTSPNTSFIAFSFFSPAEDSNLAALKTLHFPFFIPWKGLERFIAYCDLITSYSNTVLGSKWSPGCPTVAATAPWHPCKGSIPIMSFCKVPLKRYMDVYMHTILFKQHQQFISAPNGHWEIWVGYL